MEEQCEETCKMNKDKFCCMSECTLNAFGVLTSGAFDDTKAKAVIATSVDSKPAWTSAVSIVMK